MKNVDKALSDKLLDEAKQYVNGDDERKYQHKIEIISLMLKGFSPGELEEKGVVSRPTLNLWLKSVKERGDFSLLKESQSKGRPKKLEGKEIERLISALNEDSTIYGYKSWNGKAIHDFILTSFNQDLCLRHCQRIKQELIKKGKIKDTKEGSR